MRGVVQEAAQSCVFLAVVWVRLSLPAHTAAACVAETADGEGGGWVRAFTARWAQGARRLGEGAAIVQAANQTMSRVWPVPLPGAGAGVHGPCVGFHVARLSLCGSGFNGFQP